jgi:carotenoid cleavage dioxygenase
MSRLRTNRSRTPESADRSRRSFFWKFGASISGALAAPAVMASDGSGDLEELAAQVARLEAEKALRMLHQQFEQALDSGRYEVVVGLFASDAQVVFNGGVFDNRRGGVGRLYRDRFRSGKAGKRIDPAPGFELDAGQQTDTVDVAPDRLSAQAAFPYSIQVGAAIESDASLVSMARLHGEGVQTWWEGGVYRLAYRRDTLDDPWKISRLEYDTLSRADYRPGRSYAGPIAVAPLTTRFPQDREGPDALLS